MTQEITLGKQVFKLPYADLLPSLSEDEYNALRTDIIARGIVVPVVIDEQWNVIDGQHRLKIAASLGLVDVPLDVRRFASNTEREALALDLNLHRRHMSTDQLYKVIVWRRQKGESGPRIAEALGISEGTVRNALSGSQDYEGELPSRVTGKDGKSYPAKQTNVRAKNVKEASRALSLLQELDDAEGDLTVDDLKRAAKAHRQEQARQEYITDLIDTSTPANLTNCILHGDMREVGVHIADNSVDLILTDPPYPAEYLPLYGDLSSLASRILRPGGLCLAYSGQIHIPAVIGYLSSHLEYIWTFAIRHSGGNQNIFKVNVNTGWKPVFAYVKPPLKPWWDSFIDVVSGGREKDLHAWQQAEAEAAYFIEHLTPPGGLVVDPFCGSGTTLLAAKRLGRRYIGIEVNQETTQKATARINA